MVQSPLIVTLATTFFASSVMSSLVLAADAPKFPACVIAVDAKHMIHRTEIQNDFGKNKRWVFVKDGEIVHKQSVGAKNEYQHPDNEPGIYTVYVDQYVYGTYRVISNVISYRVPETEAKNVETPSPDSDLPCRLYFGHNRIVNRSLVDDEFAIWSFAWVIKKDGKVRMEISAKNATQHSTSSDIYGKPGKYEVFVGSSHRGKDHPMSNVLKFEIKAPPIKAEPPGASNAATP